jgi:hypothetical protein
MGQQQFFLISMKIAALFATGKSEIPTWKLPFC